MAFVKNIKRPTDQALLDMVQDRLSPAQIAKTVPCSIDSVRSWLRELGCSHNHKGKWFLPNEARETPRRPSLPAKKPSLNISRSVLQEQFPFIRTHVTITDDGSRITLPDLSMLASARAERDRRERRK